MGKNKRIKFAFMTIQEARSLSIAQLRTIYEEGEAGSISDWLMESLTGSKKNDRTTQRDKELSPGQNLKLNDYLQALLRHEPVQYVLHESWFCGLKFYVDKHVLIPRPETEELVEWIISDCKFPVDELKILDIGSGSGCIPIALKRRIRKAEVWSCDISKEALEVAKQNASTLGTAVNFIQLDFLDPRQHDQLPSATIIVSNPPYVPENNRELMHPNVLQYEPHTALFVPDNDPLIFYKMICEFGKQKLNPGGTIYMEIHEDLGKAVSGLFESNGYKTELKKDMHGKDRMVRAIR
jgi:release factor glutamine methyltransferase